MIVLDEGTADDAARGVEAIATLLDEVQFPATKEEIIDTIGHERIEVGPHGTRTVRSVIETLAPVQFLSSHEVEEAVAHSWDAIVGGR